VTDPPLTRESSMSDTDANPQNGEKKDKAKKPHHPRDPAREVVETIVFVVVLVLLLKLFVTEAFVIPTGSMAETLYGYQKLVTCPKCGHEFPVNSHDEVEGRANDGRRLPLYGYCCPNCRYQGQILTDEMQPHPEVGPLKNRTGDRVLVLKPLFHVREPERGDVVVFKFPEKPQDKFEAANYIKRAMGFGKETVAFYRGDLFVTTYLTYPPGDRYPRPEDPLDLWKPRYMYSNAHREGDNPDGVDLFNASRRSRFPRGNNGFGTEGFEIVRKAEKHLLADMRLVWDNDRQPEEFVKHKIPPRWHIPAGSEGGWKPDNAHQPKSFSHAGADRHWVRYRHLKESWKTLPPDRVDPTPPTDFAELARQQPKHIDNYLGYNAGHEYNPQLNRLEPQRTDWQDKWVGDLILECEAELGDGGEVALELSKGVNRFRAVFGGGKVRLERDGPGAETFGNRERDCKVAAGKYQLRFANVDCKLWVWVNDRLIDFGEEGDYLPPNLEDEGNFVDAAPDGAGRRVPKNGAQDDGWTYKNDVDAPASVGAKGQVTVRSLKLFRDIYYAPTTGSGSWSDSRVPALYYVQPGHYLCLGDNSAQSSDSRTWGTVPERLMLGKAVFVFFPVGRVGFIK
jgi:signal peptidase I